MTRKTESRLNRILAADRHLRLAAALKAKRAQLWLRLCDDVLSHAERRNAIALERETTGHIVYRTQAARRAFAS